MAGRRRSASQGGSQGGPVFEVPEEVAAHQYFETELTATENQLFSSTSEDEGYYAFMDKEDVYRIVNGSHLTWKRRLRDVLNGVPHRRDAVLHITFNVISIVAVVLSCITFCLATLPQYLNNRSGKGVDLSNPFFWIDLVCVSVFAVEVGLRTWVNLDSGFREIVDIFYLVDLVTILGFFVDTMVDALSDTASSGASFVRLLRLFRVFRVFKLSRHSKSLQLVAIVLRKSAGGLTVLTLPLLMITLGFSSVIYFVEVYSLTWNSKIRMWLTDSNARGPFQSIPDAIWFTASTVTTVGFGDIVPNTYIGKFFAVLACFLGILILSFPNIVLGGNLQYAFASFYRERARAALGKKFRKVYHMLCFVNELKRIADERAVLRQYEMPQEVQITDGSWESSSSPVNSPTLVGGTRERDVLLFSDEAPTPLKRSNAASPNSGMRVGAVHLQTTPASGTHKTRGPTINFLAAKSELDLFKRAGVENITNDNIRKWQLNGLRAVTILRRLLEVCSGVGTVQELHLSLVNSGVAVHSTDIAVAALYLMEAEFLQVFVFRRGATNMLLSLTHQACVELMVHAEEGNVDCIRSIDMAKLMWKRTSQTQPPFSLQLLMPTYPMWAATEKMVDNKEHTPTPDYKIVFWKMADPASHSRTLSNAKKRGSMVPPLRASQIGGHPHTSAVSLEKAKETWRGVISRQVEKIKFLENQLQESKQMQQLAAFI